MTSKYRRQSWRKLLLMRDKTTLINFPSEIIIKGSHLPRGGDLKIEDLDYRRI